MKNVYLHFIKYTQYQNMFQMEIVKLKKIYTMCVTFLRKIMNLNLINYVSHMQTKCKLSQQLTSVRLASSLCSLVDGYQHFR